MKHKPIFHWSGETFWGREMQEPSASHLAQLEMKKVGKASTACHPNKDGTWGNRSLLFESGVELLFLEEGARFLSLFFLGKEFLQELIQWI